MCYLTVTNNFFSDYSHKELHHGDNQSSQGSKNLSPTGIWYVQAVNSCVNFLKGIVSFVTIVTISIVTFLMNIFHYQ